MQYRQKAVWAVITALSVTTGAVFGADSASDPTPGLKGADAKKGLGHVERANKLIGKEVKGTDNQKLGKIDNVVVDLESGRILYVVLDTGLTGKNRALAPQIFTDTHSDTARVNLDKAKIDSAPEFTRDMDKPGQLGQASFVNQVYQHCGQAAWWQGATAASAGSFNNVHKAKDLVGMNVKNVSNQDIGDIDNVVLDVPAGRVTYVIMQPDREFKPGNNDLFALPPDAFTLGSDQKHLVSDLSKEKLTGAPHFSKDNWAEISNPRWASQVYQYYGKQAYFEGGSLQPTGKDTDKDKN
jgi:sporulation protein YlmC with PRC-barrel domain